MKLICLQIMGAAMYNKHAILQRFNQASADELNAGLAWYQDAHDWCKDIATQHELSLETVVGIVAALSPACAWEKNLADALAIIQHGELAIVSTYGLNKDKALVILDGSEPLDVLGGHKVRSFYHNILCPNDTAHVTIDRHAIRVVAETTKLNVVPDKDYYLIADMYKDAARELELVPCQLQAIAWLVQRQQYGYQLQLL